MTREHKLALILGFALVLVVGVLISDHLSGARQATLESILDDRVAEAPLLAPGRPIPQTTPATEDVFASNATHEPESAPEQAAGVLAQAPERQAIPPAQLITGQPADEPLTLADRGEARGPSLSVDELRRYARDQFGIELTPVTPVVGMADDRAPRSTTQPAQREPERSAPAYPAPRLHTVQPDETLWSIANRYYEEGSLHAPLAAYNRSRLPDPSALRVGVTLLIPTRAELLGSSDAALAARGAEAKPQSTKPGATKPASKPDAKPAAPAREYVVKKGDTLGDISMASLGAAKRWREIYELNQDRIDDPDNVVVGTRLRLPPK